MFPQIARHDYPATSGVCDVVVAQDHVVEGDGWGRNFFQLIVVLQQSVQLS